MPKILQLDRQVANLIAAGEVVERPASVVKELVENSIDAGARIITVEIKRGGLEFIRITDDGCGIDREDIPTAFLRHATSKIRSADDLASIGTMGFRGEALASIAAVAKVELFSRVPGETSGVCYEIHGGEEVSFTEAGCADGTTIIVRELFYNTPARMKFIKRDITEAGYVHTAVRRAALSHPEISFKLIKDGEELLLTPGDNSLSSAIYSVYGRSFAAGLQKARASHEGINVFGYVSNPNFSQGNRTRQEFFVNTRPVKSRILSAALEEAYKNRLMQNRFPACVLHIEVNPSLLDVNVHPAKTEVKFAVERQVFDAVYLAAKDAVDEGDARAEISAVPRQAMRFETPEPKKYTQTAIPQSTGFRAVGQMKIPQQDRRQEASLSDVNELPGDTLPANREGKDAGRAQENKEYHEYSVAYSTKTGVRSFALPERSAPELRQPTVYYKTSEAPALPKWKIVGEVFDSYIIVEDGDDVLFIDKHAAHERIIFERLKQESAKPLSQLLIEPIVLQPDRDEYDALMDNRELLTGMGFDIDEFGGGSIIVRSLPGDISRKDGAAMVQEAAQCLIEHRREGLQERRDETLRLVACKAALKAGSMTTRAEQYALVEKVMQFDDIKYCPHGRPVAAVLKKSELERRFGRS